MGQGIPMYLIYAYDYFYNSGLFYHSSRKKKLDVTRCNYLFHLLNQEPEPVLVCFLCVAIASVVARGSIL
jgi:hypothetical protein